jgi:hypothetical protein
MLPIFARTGFFQFEKNSNNKRVFINVRYPNKLPRDLVTINDIATLKEFKNKLHIYYKTALDKCYDVHGKRFA